MPPMLFLETAVLANITIAIGSHEDYGFFESKIYPVSSVAYGAIDKPACFHFQKPDSEPPPQHTALATDTHKMGSQEMAS